MPSHSCDVFVSYAHADDQPPLGAAKGWVTTLAWELRKLLVSKLGGRNVEIFMDHQLAGNKPLTDELLNKVRGSRILLLLMSPGYLNSHWCQRELGSFLEAQAERNRRDHIFIVELEPSDRRGWHPAIQELIPIRFLHSEFEDKGSRRMGFPVPKLDEDNPYWRNLNELAHRIAEQLKASDSPPEEPRAKVWLAEPTEDLLEEVEGVAATLRQQGYEVIPRALLPRYGREPYLSSLEDCLEQAVLGVQLLGPKEGHHPAWEDRSFVAIQAAAADEAARDRGLRVLRWRARDLVLDDVKSTEYRTLLAGRSVFAQGLEEFKQEILRSLTRRAPLATATSPDKSDVAQVDVHALAVDCQFGRQAPEWPEGFGPKAPYPSLRSFQTHEAAIFFGREDHTERLLEILQRERFLAIVGPSGAGKSSLIQAGLLPALAPHRLGGSSDWRIASLRPGERPFRRLAEELWSAALIPGIPGEGASLPAIEAELRRGPLGLAHLVADARRGATRPFSLLVLVDQFEEIFRYAQAGGSAADESEAFVQLLLASRAVLEAEVYIALTMRTDFLGHCVRFLDLPEAINRAQYLTPRLSRAELERAIMEPASDFGGGVEPQLANELINSLGQDFDQLPLLQHALARMWTSESAPSGVPPLLTVQSLEALGGLQGALSAHAEEVFGELSSEEQALAETLFCCITLLEGSGQQARSTRRPQRLEQIAEVAECEVRDLEPVVRAFAAEGVNFLHHGTPLGPESVIDISHEALIRQWKRLRIWADEEAERAAELRRWCDRAVLRRLEQGELLAGADLARAVEWRDGAGRPPKPSWAARYVDPEGVDGFREIHDFIAASEVADDERRRQREQQERSALEAARVALSRRVFFLTLTTALFAVLTTVAITFYLKAEKSAKESRARHLASEVFFLEREPDRAQLLAVEAFKTHDLPVSNLLVRQLYSQAEGLLHTLRGHKDAVESMSFSPDGRAILTGSSDKMARLWDAATGNNLHTLEGHSGAVKSVVFSSDGRTVLTGSSDKTARLWDAASGRNLHTLSGHDESVESAVFSSDGRAVLTGSSDKTARLWDVATGHHLQTLRGHEASIVSVAFSPDDRFLLTASLDQTARLWDAATGRHLQTLHGHTAAVATAVFSPDGRIILTASGDFTARLWDTATGSSIQTLRGHVASVANGGFSPDGRTVLTASMDQTARLWDTTTGRSLQTFRGHAEAVMRADFSPDGRTVLTASVDKTARLWDAATGRDRQTFHGHEGAVMSADFSPDGRTVLTVSLDKTARLWDAAADRKPKTLHGHEGAVVSAVFSPDGRSVLTVGVDETARLWEAATGRNLQTLRGHEAQVVSADFSPDGRTIVTASQDKTAQLWDTATGRNLQTLHGHKAQVVGAVFSPGGRTVLTASFDATAQLWDVATGDQIKTLLGHDAAVYSAVFSRDGRTILTASLDQTARLWDIATGRNLQTFRGHNKRVLNAVFSPDGRTVLTASLDKTARLWDMTTHRNLSVFHGHEESVESAVFNTNGRSVLTVSGDNARLWDVATGRDLVVLRGHEESVVKGVFSQDGRTILTASRDKTARLWDAATGRNLQTLRGHEGSVVSAVFSPDGETILTASWDGTARLWPCSVCRPTEELADEILRRVGRSLTPDEREWAGLPPLPEATFDVR